MATAGMTGVGLGVAAAALLVERVGRKWILAVTGPLSALALVIFALTLGVPDDRRRPEQNATASLNPNWDGWRGPPAP
ncbi:hypothetical protein [Paenarthrobacter sp. PH39-S1]|uniref:hypothetical protein n=1 Tax=Paenarthrobacter sp. PH39-S1 TaxID=3046204 RepID=UPI0032D8BC14